MNVNIANILRDKINTLNWIERCSGLVRDYVKVDTINQGDKLVRIRKTFPVSCELTNDECASGKYLDLVPDSRKRSIIYFEDFGSRPVSFDRNKIQWESNVRLICWVNMNLFNTNACSISPALIVDVLKSIPKGRFNESDHTNILIRFNGEIPKDSRIFSRYSYDEAVNGYLLFPFDYFALSFKVFHDTDENCFDPIDIKDDDCNI